LLFCIFYVFSYKSHRKASEKLQKSLTKAIEKPQKSLRKAIGKPEKSLRKALEKPFAMFLTGGREGLSGRLGGIALFSRISPLLLFL